MTRFAWSLLLLVAGYPHAIPIASYDTDGARRLHHSRKFWINRSFCSASISTATHRSKLVTTQKTGRHKTERNCGPERRSLTITDWTNRRCCAATDAAFGT
jgi:hypothetical protein